MITSDVNIGGQTVCECYLCSSSTDCNINNSYSTGSSDMLDGVYLCSFSAVVGHAWG